MRAHGVPKFPDPTGGRLLIKAGPGSGLNPGSPAFQSAQQACKSLAPSGLAAPGSAATAQMQAKALRFASCMRSHGVPSFPDPTFSGADVRDPTRPRAAAARSQQPEGGQRGRQRIRSPPATASRPGAPKRFDQHAQVLLFLSVSGLARF